MNNNKPIYYYILQNIKKIQSPQTDKYRQMKNSQILTIYFLLFTIVCLCNCEFLVINNPKNNLQVENIFGDSQRQILSQSDNVKKQGDLGAELIGFVLGPIAFILSFVMIWYNEKRAAINKNRLIIVQKLLDKQLQNIGKIQQIQPEINNILTQKLQNKSKTNLIYISGNVQVQEPAYDPITKLKIQKSIKLSREVQVRQYRKIGTKRDEEPELGWYSYHAAEGGGRLNDQSAWFLKSEVFVAQAAYVKGFKMNQSQMKSFMGNSAVNPSQQIALAIVEYTKNAKTQWTIQGQYIYFPAVSGQNLSHGSLRIRYTYYKPQIISIIASEGQNKNLQPFKIDLYQNKGHHDKLCCEGQSICCACNAIGQLMKPFNQIDIVMQGSKTKDEMMETMISTNKVVTNALRITALIVMIVGIVAFFNPIVSILGWIPIVGGFLQGTAGGLIIIGAIIVSVPMFLITFSLAWLVYHPKTGAIFLIAGLLVVAIIVILDQTVQSR